MLPQVKGASNQPQSPDAGAIISRTDKESLLQNAGLGTMGNRSSIGQGLISGERSLERKLERNPSVMSRKELIKQECNLLLETRLPNIMSLMNSEKNIGLNLGFY